MQLHLSKKVMSMLIIFAMLISLLPPAQSFASSAAPDLLITELVPDSTNVNSTEGKGIDGYEYIEIYNNTDDTINLRDYSIRYIHGANDIHWEYLTDEEINIPAGTAIVLWAINRFSEKDDQNIEKFNLNYGTNLEENVTLFKLNGADGMHNSAARTFAIRDASGELIVTASYDNDDQTKADKGINYQIPATGSIAMVMMDGAGTIAASPGIVTPDQLINEVVNPSLSIQHHVTIPQIYNDQTYTITARVNPTEAVTEAYVYYKSSADDDYTELVMDANDSVYTATIPVEAISEGTQLSYYITASSPGYEDDITDEYQIRIIPRDSMEIIAPAMLITELLPNSANIGGADGYEFIEVYNNTTEDIQFKDYKIYYRYTDSGPDADVIWPTDDEEIVIKATDTMVFWVINSANGSQTVADFNRQFGTELVEGENIVKIYSDGMANTSRRGVMIGTNTHKEIAVAYYDGSLSNVENHGIHYRYSAMPDMIQLAAGTVKASPGAVTLEQIPAVPLQPVIDTEAPVYVDMTDMQTISQSQALNIKADVTDDHMVKTVALFYKTDNDADYVKRYLYEDYSSKMYYHTIASPELIGRNYVEYYFVISDGTNIISTDLVRVDIENGSDASPVRINLAEGEVVSGTEYIKGAATGKAVGDIELYIDDEQVEVGTFPAVEYDAYFAFEATDVNYYFKNGVTMGEEILHTFLDPITSYTTITVPIDATRLQTGFNSIAIRAGTKSGPFDDRPEENKDDFRIRNVRLVMTDGTVIYDANYSDREAELKMGDSTGREEAIEFNFELTAEHLGALAYQWDTTKVEDGEHLIAIRTNDAEKVVSVIVDNTKPIIEPSIVDGETYRGEIILDAVVKDALADVSEVSAALDGESIELPYKTSSGALLAGAHIFTIHAVDKAGNESVKEVSFHVPDENPHQPTLVSPTLGTTVKTGATTLTVNVTDPLGDMMDVTFKRGFHYDSSRSTGFNAYIGASHVEPPKQLVPGGEVKMTESELAKIKAADEDYLITDATEQFPYQRFEIKLDSSVAPTDCVEINWQGQSLEGRKVSMYAWNSLEMQWQMLDHFVAGAEDFSLHATVAAGNYNDNGTINVMIQDEMPVSDDPYDFTFVWMSDTQYYAESYPDIYHRNVQWIVDNVAEHDIRYVIHTGDIVDDADQQYQWDNANEAMSILDQSGIPYGVLAGNHDVLHQTGEYTYFWENYGEDRFNHMDTYGGSYQNNRGHYDLISAGGIDFIIVYMGWNIGDAEIDWIDEVVKQYPDRKAILAFHEYLLVSNNRAPIGDEIFERVVVPNPNVIATLSGHYHDAETLIDEIDDDGDGQPDRKVYQMLADYQGAEMGGLGYIRLLQFDLENNKIHVKTYSPYLDDYNYYDPIAYPGKDEFDMDVDLGVMNKRVATDYFEINIYTEQIIGTKTNVSSGANASLQWNTLTNNALNEWYVQVNDQYSGSTNSSIWGFQAARTGQDGSGSGSGSGNQTEETSDPDKDVEIPVSDEVSKLELNSELIAKQLNENNGMVELQLSAAGETATEYEVTVNEEALSLIREHEYGVMINVGGQVLTIPAGAWPLHNNIQLNIQLSDFTGAKYYVNNGPAVTIDLTDGTSGKIKFLAPVQLQLDAVEVDIDYAGIYQWIDGEYVYVGGKFAGNKAYLEIVEAGTYIVMEYRQNFDDMTGHWAEKAVQRLTAQHVAKGVSKNRFNPAATVIRADFATMLMRALDERNPVSSTSFQDVAADKYYAAFVGKASELGIVQGSNGAFRPADEITREEAVVMLMRAYRLLHGDITYTALEQQAFTDIEQASAWAKEDITAAHRLGLIQGKDQSIFDPQNTLTRAELAQLIYNFLEIVK